jgi:hypothetical protein
VLCCASGESPNGSRSCRCKFRTFSLKRSMGALPYSLLLFTVLACGCSAALTTRDLATAGDHLIVFDPITGLEWLALGRTYRMEATQVVCLLSPTPQPTHHPAHACETVPANRGSWSVMVSSSTSS